MRIAIRGMSCNHCVHAVEKALVRVPGVESVTEVSLDRKEAIVEGSPAPDAVVAAIRDEGYEAEVVG